ncbi:MAG: hypothetical protein QOK14_1522 [Frankiaceae bacterium]|nr:hypothetical protein [Frankiaceae bacterium]
MRAVGTGGSETLGVGTAGRVGFREMSGVWAAEEEVAGVGVADRVGVEANVGDEIGAVVIVCGVVEVTSALPVGLGVPTVADVEPDAEPAVDV